jgi:hypothetical protein
MKIKEIIEKANNGQVVPYEFISVFCPSDCNIGKKIEHVFDNNWKIKVLTNSDTYAAKKFSYVTYDKISNFQYHSPTWFCTYYKNWSDYENNISVTVDGETDDVPEDSIIVVETKREYGIAKIKMDGSVISPLENKIQNATTKRDVEMQIVCETDSVRFVANCVLSGLSWNDDMSDCDVDVIVEYVEYTM